jgi:hypothetical protein
LPRHRAVDRHRDRWISKPARIETDMRTSRTALLKPTRPGSRVVVFSGAAMNPNGLPLGCGHTGAKATQRFITAYAQNETNRADPNKAKARRRDR